MLPDLVSQTGAREGLRGRRGEMAALVVAAPPGSPAVVVEGIPEAVQVVNRMTQPAAAAVVARSTAASIKTIALVCALEMDRSSLPGLLEVQSSSTWPR